MIGESQAGHDGTLSIKNGTLLSRLINDVRQSARGSPCVAEVSDLQQPYDNTPESS